MADILKEICDRKRTDIAELKKNISLEQMRKKAEAMPEATRGFAQALRKKNDDGGLALIAEIKKASPSKGVIRQDFDVAELAENYQTGGAAALSVLTDTPYFQGDYDYVRQAKAVTELPVLQKDFMLDAWQIYHARTIGADCVLLILAALEDSQAAELESLAVGLGMDVLLEAHDADELERALKLRSRLVGVNNRNLKTLQVDLATGESLLPLVKQAGRLPIAESGLYTHDDLLRLQACGAEAFLIGESLMSEANVTSATRKILGL